MKKKITSAELVRYNANNRGSSVGDCVKRSISFAFDKSYVQVSQDLNRVLNENPKLKNMGYHWNNRSIYEQLIKEYGGSDIIKLDERVTLDQFADSHPEGMYLAHTAETSQGRTNHLVAIWNGKIYDSWDSRQKFVASYYIVDGAKHSELTDIKSKIDELADEAYHMIYEEADKLIKKYRWKDPYLYVNDEYPVKGYSFTIEMDVRARFATGKKVFEFPITYVLTPTTTEEEAHKIVKNTTKVRVYDRLYAMNQKYQEAEEEQLAKDEVAAKGGDVKDARQLYMWGQEKRFYDSLPGWVKGRIHFLSVSYPGQYSDSYTLKIYPLYEFPVEDEYLDSQGCIRFEAYNASDIKDMLNRYKTKGEVEGRDYYYSEEY